MSTKGWRMLMNCRESKTIFFGKQKCHQQVNLISSVSSCLGFPENTVNLFDQNYQCFMNGTLDRELYRRTCNYISFRMVFIMCRHILSWPLKYLRYKSKDVVDINKETWAMWLRSSQLHFPLETQTTWKVHQTNKIKFIKPRLEPTEAEKIYGTSPSFLTRTPSLQNCYEDHTWPLED